MRHMTDPENQVAPIRVLVADDNTDALDTMALLLEMRGYAVAKAANGAEAVSLAQDFKPALVLLDLGMPVMDGYEAARRLRSGEGMRHCFIVAVTGYGDPVSRERTARAGFDAHFTKPLDFTKFELALDRLLPPPGTLRCDRH